MCWVIRISVYTICIWHELLWLFCCWLIGFWVFLYWSLSPLARLVKFRVFLVSGCQLFLLLLGMVFETKSAFLDDVDIWFLLIWLLASSCMWFERGSSSVLRRLSSFLSKTFCRPLVRKKSYYSSVKARLMVVVLTLCGVNYVICFFPPLLQRQWCLPYMRKTRMKMASFIWPTVARTHLGSSEVWSSYCYVNNAWRS